MLRVQGLNKRFGGRAVLRDVSFVVNRAECAGLVGPNGSGKSTLIKLIAGALEPDAGHIATSPSATIGYLPQAIDLPLHTKASDAFPALFDANSATARLEALAVRLAAERDDEHAARLSHDYDTLLREVERSQLAQHRSQQWNVSQHWDGLGLRAVDADEPVDRFSGGERTKLALLDCLARRPDILLLDEPTNHLDLPGLAWLEHQITSFAGRVLLVSHDRALLDACATIIVSIDARDGAADVFRGDYSAWADEQARREQELWDRYRRQQREERRVKRSISAIESRARHLEQETIHFYYRKRAAKVARKSTVLKARLRRELAGADHVDRPAKKPRGFRHDFDEGARTSTRLLSVENATLSVQGRPLLRDVSFEVERGQRVVLLGPNGSGKTTLLRAVLGDHSLDAGRIYRGPSVQIGYLSQEEPGVEDDQRTAIDLLSASRPWSRTQSANFLHQFLFSHDQVTTPIARLSYGERRRLALARFVVQGANLLLLDEPTNHLDLPSREAFESALAGYPGGALIVTHDRYFIERFADKLYELRDGVLRLV